MSHFQNEIIAENLAEEYPEATNKEIEAMMAERPQAEWHDDDEEDESFDELYPPREGYLPAPSERY